MIQTILVAFGGAIGAVLRYLTGVLALKLFYGSSVYTGTLFANVSGCFLAGVFLSVFQDVETGGSNLVLFLTIGVLGAYTTFSTFAIETVKLLSRPLIELLSYLFWQVAGAFAALVLGYEFANLLSRGVW